MGDWLYEQEMEQVLELVFKVRNDMGAGWSEEIYHQALCVLLAEEKIPFYSKPRRSFIHRGREIYVFEPDIIVWDKVVLELKVLLEYKARQFPKRNQAQLLQYLNIFQMNLGILFNFAHPKVGIQRMVFDPVEFKLEESYERMMPFVDENDKQILRQVQRAIKMIASEYGLGFSEIIYRHLLEAELAYQDLIYARDVEIKAHWENQLLGRQKTSYFLIANKFLLHVRSSLDLIPVHDFIKTRTYLKALGLEVGWIVNFGNDTLQIIATAVK